MNNELRAMAKAALATGYIVCLLLLAIRFTTPANAEVGCSPERGQMFNTCATLDESQVIFFR